MLTTTLSNLLATVLETSIAAELELSNRDEIRVRQYESQVDKYDQQRGRAPRFPLTNK